MIKLFDFAYYCIYQLNRKGYRKNNHKYTKGFLAMMFSIWTAQSMFLVKVVFDLIIHINLFVLIIISAVISYTSVYYVSGKLYESSGARNFIIKEYDKKYPFKSQSKYLQSFILWLATMVWWAFCVILSFKVKKWLHSLP